MAILISANDRVPVTFGDVTIDFAPIAQGKKITLTQMFQHAGTDYSKIIEASRELLKHTIKNVAGVFYSDEQPFVLEMNNNIVTDSCLDDLCNLDFFEKLITVGGMFLSSSPKEGQLIHPATGEVIEGVTVKKSYRVRI